VRGDMGLKWGLDTVKPHSGVLLEKGIYGFLLMGGKAPSAAASYAASLGSVNDCFLEAPKLQILKLMKIVFCYVRFQKCGFFISTKSRCCLFFNENTDTQSFWRLFPDFVLCRLGILSHSHLN